MFSFQLFTSVFSISQGSSDSFQSLSHSNNPAKLSGSGCSSNCSTTSQEFSITTSQEFSILSGFSSSGLFSSILVTSFHKRYQTTGSFLLNIFENSSGNILFAT
jgi:hypothetical protein